MCSSSAIEVCEYCYLTVEALHQPVKKRKKWNRLCRGIDCAVYWHPPTIHHITRKPNEAVEEEGRRLQKNSSEKCICRVLNKITKMLSTSFKISDCNSTSSVSGYTIHRRVKPSSERDELDTVRFPPQACIFEDVDTVILGNNSRVVKGGRNQGHKDGIGGISIQGYDENVSHNSANNIYTREEGDEPNYDKNPSRKIIRWHCYKCLHIDVPLRYKVHYNDYPHHGFLYPVNEIELSDLNGHQKTLLPVG